MKKMWPYKEPTLRKPDTQYRDLLSKIMDSGVRSTSFHGEEKRSLFGYTLRFDPANGFPLLTERDLSDKRFTGAIGEILAFAHGARTQSELEKWGCNWWKAWTTKEKCAQFGLEEGDIGPGSYGAAFGNYPHPEGGTINQFERVLQQAKDYPHATTHRIDPWIPPYATGTKESPRKVTVAPCHGWIRFEILADETMIFFHNQRSADVPVGLQFNLIQYGALAMAFSHLLGYQLREIIYYIEDAHIYEQQFEAVGKLLSPSRPTQIFPTVSLDNEVTNFFDLRPSHFKIGEDYQPHDWFTIPTPV